MKKIATPYAETVNILTFLALLLTLLGASSFWIADFAPVFANLIQGKCPTTEALLQWLTVR